MKYFDFKINLTDKRDEITNDDLIKAGMPPEFLGRIPVITSTEDLDVEFSSISISLRTKVISDLIVDNLLTTYS